MGADAILLELGRVAHAQGDNARARALYRESLRVPRETGDRVGIAESLAGLAEWPGQRAKPSEGHGCSGRWKACGRLLGHRSRR